MSAVDGPALRSVRTHFKVPLRRIARLLGMSHGHLSKVERGEAGRPVTPAILNAYQRALKVDIAAVVGNRDSAAAKGWKPGIMTVVQRRVYTSRVAAVARPGGPLLT